MTSESLPIAGWNGPSVPPTRSSRVVDLNVVKVRITSNLADFPAFEHFSRFSDDPDRVDYEIHCTDLDQNPMDEAHLAAVVDGTQRAKRFQKGYYRGPYFGGPVYLITRGQRFHVFGRSLSKIVWPYFVKHILTMHAADQGVLHLKTAGFVLDGRATLVAGIGGGGKTVFVAQACLSGANFLTNTHAIVDGGVAHAVPSALRIRDDDCFHALIRQRGLLRHIDRDEYVVSPDVLFDQRSVQKAPVHNIVVADYRPQNGHAFRTISPAECLAFLDQFAVAVTTYGLKDDLFVHFDYDVSRYADYYNSMRAQLFALCKSSNCYYANVDMLDALERATVMRALRDDGPARPADAGLPRQAGR